MTAQVSFVLFYNRGRIISDFLAAATRLDPAALML